MLVKYKKMHEKIAMGLLSFMPGEEKLPALKKTMQRYEEQPDWQLFLWKREEDFIGVIGVQVEEHSFTVQHAAVNPSFRGEGVGKALVREIRNLMEPRRMILGPATEAFLQKCLQDEFYS